MELDTQIEKSVLISVLKSTNQIMDQSLSGMFLQSTL